MEEIISPIFPWGSSSVLISLPIPLPVDILSGVIDGWSVVPLSTVPRSGGLLVRSGRVVQERFSSSDGPGFTGMNLSTSKGNWYGVAGSNSGWGIVQWVQH